LRTSGPDADMNCLFVATRLPCSRETSASCRLSLGDLRSLPRTRPSGP